MERLGLILAAGEGTRMCSTQSKVLHSVCGFSLIDYVIGALDGLCTDSPVLVVGHAREQVMEHVGDKARFAIQEPRLGTGHAVMVARSFLEGCTGVVTILAGDMPLIRRSTVEALISQTIDNGLAGCVLTALAENPEGYGRIVRNEKNEVVGIVEHKDADSHIRTIREINTSVFCFDIAQLLAALDELTTNNAQKEYYLTDCISIMVKKGLKIEACLCPDPLECLGINDRVQLAEASAVLYTRKNRELMRAGVTLVDPSATYVDSDVTVGRDTVIYPNNYLLRGTVIGENCTLLPGNRLQNTVIGNGVRLECSVLDQAEVGDGTTVGPYAYLRPKAKIGKKARIGDFVEIKNATLGDGSKASHLAYVGDAEIGPNCNIGCGTIFVNYDGKNKFRTKVGEHAFIGSNSNLVAPITIGDNAYIAAGSTVTKDIPENALCVARSREYIKENWVKKQGDKE